jgi:hypothetical protein
MEEIVQVLWEVDHSELIVGNPWDFCPAAQASPHPPIKCYYFTKYY